jgi:PAS domain S-box-containing protein
MTHGPSEPGLAAELEEVRARLAEAEEALRAIRDGNVDAVVVTGGRGEQVFTLIGADRVYRQLIESMSEGAATVSGDGVILYGNVRLAEMLGRPLHQVFGTVLRSYLAASDQEAFDAILAHTRTTPSRLEVNLENNEGHLVPVYLSVSPLQSDEAETVFCVVLTDLTEQKRHEHVVATERLARLILEQVAEAIVVCNDQGQVIRVSRAAEWFCDTSPLLRPFVEVFPLRTDDAESFHLAPVFRGETLRDVDVALERQGQRVDLILNAGPLFSGQEILGCVVTLTDITHRKRAEEERAKLEAQLHQAQKMESVGRLAGGVAHDFNNMLAVILGYAELALRQLDPAMPLHADLTEIHAAATRSADLTRQLLAFARRQTVAPEILDLNATLASMLKMLRRLIGENVDVKWQPAADLWPVNIDPSQIDQILANLCVNSRDAISGVGTVTIRTENSALDERYCAENAGCVPGDYVRLSLRDDGCGMDTDTLSHLFEPFFTTKALGTGTGLGLATVYGIVKQNHGYITVDSEPDRGTTFQIYVPRYVGKAAQARPEDSTGPALRGRETILLVEDEPAILKMAKRMLEQQGYTVLAARIPGEALNLAREHTGEINLLITDVVMPEMDGRSLAKKLLSYYPRLKSLFTSGYTADVIAHHGVLDEGVHFIQKPYSTQALAAKVSGALDGPT